MQDIKKISWPSWPNYTSKDIESVARVVRSNQISSSIEVKKFENQFSKFNKSKYVKAVGNATQGLHLALSALEIGKNDEVIVTNYSWISTASCILMQNAKPVFVDIELDTLGADPKLIEKAITKKTKAIIVVHMFGNPCKIEQIQKIAKKHGIYLIEDASHSHGAKFKKKKVGNFSDIAVFSCHQRKNLSAGEGGLVVCKNKFLDDRIYKLRSFGEDKLSYNYRMTEFCAVLGQSSLKKLNDENKCRNNNVKFLLKSFNLNKYFTINMPQEKCYSVFHKLTFIYQNNLFTKDINFFIKYINNLGIPFSHTYQPLSHHPNFNVNKNKNKSFPNIDLNYNKQKHFKNTFDICYKKLLELSIHRPVTKHHIQFLITNLKSYIKKYSIKETIRKRIVILGKNGFVASNLIKLLKKNKINHLALSKEFMNLLNKSSVKNLKNIIKPNDQIVFLSTILPRKKGKLMYEKNILILNNVIEALKNTEFKQILYVSSDAIYDKNVKVINENTIKKPETFYGRMHLKRELSLSHLFGDKICILRPTMIYGKNDPHAGYGPNKFLNQINQSKDISIFGVGEEKRDHIFINDVVHTMLYCLQNDFKGHLNIASGELFSFMDIAKECLKKNKMVKIKLISRKEAIPYNGFREFNIKKLKKFINVEKFTKLKAYIKNF